VRTVGECASKCSEKKCVAAQFDSTSSSVILKYQIDRVLRLMLFVLVLTDIHSPDESAWYQRVGVSNGVRRADRRHLPSYSRLCEVQELTDAIDGAN